jgi:oligopeptidase B
LAYSWDNTGSETYTLQVKNLETGTLLADTVQGTGTSLVWAADNQTLFYSTLDAMKRPYRLYRHRLGSSAERDVLVYEEKNEKFFLSAGKSKDEKYLFLSLHSKNTSEEHFLEAATPEASFRILAERQEGIEYSAEHQDGRFLITTNWDAVNFRVMEAPVSNPARAEWKEWYPHRPEVKLEGLDVFRGYTVLFERSNGNTEIRVIDLKDRTEHKIDFGETVYTSGAGSNPDYESEVLRVGFTSLLTPSTVYDYNMRTRAREVKKRQEVLGGYDSSRYSSERLFAVSADGTKIPISVVYKKGLKRDGTAPGWLYGYGSYGISMDPGFSSNRLSLLDRGFVYAIAHIRGGGDMGRPWYDAG